MERKEKESTGGCSTTNLGYNLKTLLQGVVGSTAYGLATPESDIDRLAVHLTPVESVLGFGLSKRQQTVVTNNPDSTSHDIGKYLSLVLGGNPTVTELLFLDDYEVGSYEGDVLLYNRKHFIGAKAVRDSYGGYAVQQYKRLLSRGDGSFSADTRKRTGKHSRHCLRLLLQGTELLSTGSVNIRLSKDSQAVVWSAGEMAERGRLGALEALYTTWNDHLLAAYENTVLPEYPDRERAEQLLVDIRRKALDKGDR